MLVEPALASGGQEAEEEVVNVLERILAEASAGLRLALEHEAYCVLRLGAELLVCALAVAYALFVCCGHDNKRGAAAGLTGWSRRMFERGYRRGRSS
jgi:hypothetical protein